MTNDLLNWGTAAFCWALAIAFHTRRSLRFFLFFENIRPDEAHLWHIGPMRRYVGKWLGVMGLVCALRALVFHLGHYNFGNALVLIVIFIFFHLAAQRPRFRRHEPHSDPS